MIFNDSLFARVTEIYEKRRMDASDHAYEINRKLDADREFSENKEKLKRANFLSQKCEFENNAEGAEKYREEYLKLKEERKAILAKKGLSESDLSVNYACKKCGDTGFLPQGGNCACFFATLKTVINETLGITEKGLPSFSDLKTDGDGEEKLKNKLTAYCEIFPDFKSVRNLIFTGAPGTGKTFAAGCIANAVGQKNANAIFLSAVRLNDLFLRYHTSGEKDRKAVFSLITDCDLLIIDDLGTEPVLKNVTVEYLTSFLSERLANAKPFVITTNLNPEEMIARYTERLVSRLSSAETAIIPFSGKDKRRG